MGPQCDLQDLDLWKQRGFYSHLNAKGQFVRPITIDKDFSVAVVKLAFRIVDAIDFILKHNIGRYKQRVFSLREKVTDEQLKSIRGKIQELVNETFDFEHKKPEDSK